MDAQAAARLGDEIAHGFGVAAMVAGAVAGALIGAAVIIAGSIAAGGLSMFQIVKGLTTIFDLPEPTTGVLIRGSLNVYINQRNSMRAGDDVSEDCSGLPLNHPLWPFPVLIAEGSATVHIKGKPAARLHAKMVCGAHIKTGSPNTFIGGPTERVAFVLDLEEWLHTGLEALGIVAALGGLVLAAIAGWAALGAFVGIGALMMGGMELLGQLGDRLGPGYRDLLQGVAGMVLLGLSPKMARRAPAALEEGSGAPRFKPGHTLEEIRTMNKPDRPLPETYLEPDYIAEHLAQFDKGASRIMTKANLDKYGIGQRDGTSFIMPSHEADQLLACTAGDNAALEKALGLDPGFLDKNQLVRVDIPEPNKWGLRMPQGTEAGANDKWLPGGKLPDGASEAVIDGGKLTASDLITTPLKR